MTHRWIVRGWDRVRHDVLGRETRHPVARVAARLLVGIVVSGTVALPFALEHGIEQTRVQDRIGVVPATLTLTGNSTSELHLGLLGNLRVPVSRGPLGISATVDGSPATTGGGGVGSYFSPQMLQVYGGLFHDPGTAVEGYVDALQRDLRHEVLAAEARYALVGGLLLAGVWAVTDRSLRELVARHRVKVAALVLPGVLLVTSGAAWAQFRDWSDDGTSTAPEFGLPSLDGTAVSGTVTDSAILRLAVEQAYPKVKKLVERQELATSAFVAGAIAQLQGARSAMEGPAADEVAVMMQSDMHCNAAMTKVQHEVVSMLDDAYGKDAISLLAITGDLTTNGTAAERGCVEDEAAIANGAPVAAVTGNHESDLSRAQMKAAGMHVLEGGAEKLAGISVLGADDPERTEMFGATRLTGDATEASVGKDLRAAALKSPPDLVLLHEAYAVQGFLGADVTDMRAFLDARGSATTAYEDGVRDVPARAVFYGHWHRVVEPRVVWNSDGSWTLVMELNTSGGAIASPTLNDFSTPWSAPAQTASFPVVFENRETGLVTGYQIYSFGVDGTVTVSPRVDVGPPGGRPVPAITGADRGTRPTSR